MFEDSTFESTGRIKTRSRRWMIATLPFNGAIVVILVLIPLVYPDALPNHMMTSLLVAPATPLAETPPPAPPVRTASRNDFQPIDISPFTAPRRIPISIADGQDRAPSNVITSDIGAGIPGADGANPFGAQRTATVVHPDVARPTHVSSALIEGLLIYKNVPQYPVIPKTMGVQGTVVLQATISKSGTIENLRVISGPALLQQAAIDAVKTWRYRPYMLNKEPVEVETTVSVIFKLER
jgi:periplasmic protein TonB